MLRVVREHWPSLPAVVVTRAIGRLTACGGSDGEIVAYLRAVAAFQRDPHRYAEPAFDGLERAHNVFGAACTETRFRAWIERRRRPKHAVAEPLPSDDVETQSPDEFRASADAAFEAVRRL